MNGMTRLVEALQSHGIKGRGKSWQCPAHDDRSPSLSIDQGEKGAVLECKAGCPTEDVLSVLGLTWPDLFDEPLEKREKPQVVAEYLYSDEHGELLMVVKRLEPGYDGERKTFRQYRPDGTPGVKGVRRVLYRLPEVLNEAAAGGTVLIVEGEKDTDNLAALGCVATCNVGGAGKWRDEYTASLQGASQVVVIADRDAPGRKHAASVVASVQAAGIPVLLLEPARGKDVSDHLAAGLQYDDLVPVDLPQDTTQDASGTEGAPSSAGRPWPVLAPEAFHGLPGRIVRTIEPHTEADPAAMLFTLYAAAGAVIGKEPHMRAGAEHHGTRIWPLIIGRTAGGMKGTSWAEVRQILKATEPVFASEHVMGGLSSAEGLIYQVRNPTGDPDSDDYDEGVPDKRLLIVESEFASVLAQGKREGNTLLPNLRQAWDGGTLRTMTIRPRVATDPHIVIVGHITPTELRVKLNEAERAGGTANRFLPVLSKRSKLLPNGGDLSYATVKELGAKLAAVIEKAKFVGRMKRSLEAEEYWAQLYTRLASDHAGDGQVAQIVARAAPQVLRLSVLAALLDGHDYIDVVHVQTAEALWSYAEDSAWYVFSEGSGNPDLDRLKQFVDAAGTEGVTRTAVVAECFGRNRTKAQIDELWGQLLALDGYEEWSAPTGGRPTKGLRRTKPN